MGEIETTSGQVTPAEPQPTSSGPTLAVQINLDARGGFQIGANRPLTQLQTMNVLADVLRAMVEGLVVAESQGQASPGAEAPPRRSDLVVPRAVPRNLGRMQRVR